VMITVFYDGTCGLCHRAVKFLVARDPHGERFRYAPLQGETALRDLPEPSELPDSMVIKMANGETFTRGDAALRLGRELSLGWRLMSIIGGLFPTFCRDLLYDFIAARRYAWFGRSETVCPLLPPDQREFFLP
jgi:predicted DCC family thiol-disulfide oxidoreductase YuxK